MDLLRHLRFFVAVAEEGHFGHAADRLGMTQPPVSQGVQRLEAKLGVTLLTRGSRGVHLTTAGAELLPRARALLDGAEQFEEEARRQRENRGAVRIGVIPALTDRQVAACTAAVRAAAPDPAARTVITTTAPTTDLVEAVAAGRLDCAAVHHPALIGALTPGPVLKIRRWLLIPSDRKPSIRGLRGLACATAPRNHGTAAFDLLVDTLRTKGLDPDFLPAPGDREAITAVAAGRAFALTTDPELDGPGVVRAPAGDDLALRVRLVWQESAAEDVRTAFEASLRGDR
ncbi:DNA-binding transcriptional regulator, LysR family [Saccharopolyspora antimicrobica]|uniref:DNA-binding transcriptional LysR family regulator n=1 Tax=Saccharopolyspora antimicrobica TaxID=455193 RepID=A0A1I5KCY4_9PSEU|nr:LysR family transcriptional regulator [Saccharopolyspora antimicrobica]RKT81956.1 DNA-binding transcriptional LysR family regulator [Saccharopolyspora antimicrobica]SFO82932.1 DNA-binding transcriptional regulator, LysR family [Saccharopolyspora antimicrobica]